MTVDRPSYYLGCAKETRSIVKQLGMPEKWLDKECIEAIEGVYWINSKFHIATAIAYLWRYKKKRSNDEKDDLIKARWYIDRHCQINQESFLRNPTAKKQIEEAIASIDLLLRIS